MNKQCMADAINYQFKLNINLKMTMTRCKL